MKRYTFVGLALCLGGTILALTIVTLMMNVKPGHASLPQKPAAPDLVVAVEVPEGTTLADSTITYTILYTNSLPMTLSDVVVVGTLARKQYYSGTYLSDPLIPTTSFTYTGHFETGFDLSWHLGDLVGQTGGQIQITTTVPPRAEPPWKDSERWPLLGMSAAISTSTSGVSVGNSEGEDADTASVMVVGPILRLGKQDDPDEVRPGRLLTYTLTLENKERDDAIPANHIVITDMVPDHTTFYGASPSGHYSPTSPSGGLVIWHPPDPLESGQSLEVSFTVRLTGSLPNCSMGNVRNQKEDYEVSSDETINTVNGKDNRSTSIDDVLEKRVETSSPPPEEDRVFPGGFVTYTINIYNPLHDQTLTGLRLTDTLPGDPTPFVYQGMLNGGPEPISVSRRIIWDGLEVAAGDVATLTFGAQVPTHIDIPENKQSRRYQNELSASVSGVNICPMNDKGSSEVKVQTQIWMDKDVDPSLVLSGELVTYTITLENFGDTPVNNVRLTDTLPNTDGADFSYVARLDGPDPVPGYSDNPVVWEVSIPANDEISFSFLARAIGYPLETYGNNLSASALGTSIPARTNRAKVKIDSPFRIQKVANPGETFVGETVQYSVTICNVATGTYTLDEFRDTLASGLYAGGMGNYVYDIDPNVDLAGGECWEHVFDVDVTRDVDCETLPRTIKNEDGQVEFDVVDPVTLTYENTADLAPLDVNSHVRIEKEADHKVALSGESVIYTVTLINDHPTVQVSGVSVEDTLPGHEGVYFQYQGMVDGANPTSTGDPDAGGPIRWEGLSIPAGGQQVLVFRVQIPEGIDIDRKYKNNDVVASTAQPICIGKVESEAEIEAVDEIVELTKKVDPESVAPFGAVEYEIRLKNLDTQPITGVVVTDTLPTAVLPPHFAFRYMVEGDPEPSEIVGQKIIWRDLTIPADETLKLRFAAQAAILLGTYINDVAAWCPRSREILCRDVESVDVMPGIVLYKTVYPTQTVAGRIVAYTVTLHNQSEEDLADVRLTDTLPTGFQYQYMLNGPAPLVVNPPIVAWGLDQLKKGNSQRFVFRVRVGLRSPSGTYSNSIQGSSASALIPGFDETAALVVEAADFYEVYLPLVVRNYAP